MKTIRLNDGRKKNFYPNTKPDMISNWVRLIPMLTLSWLRLRNLSASWLRQNPNRWASMSNMRRSNPWSPPPARSRTRKCYQKPRRKDRKCLISTCKSGCIRESRRSSPIKLTPFLPPNLKPIRSMRLRGRSSMCCKRNKCLLINRAKLRKPSLTINSRNCA